MKSALDVHRALLDDAVPHEMVRLRTPLLYADDLPRVLDVEAARCVAVRCYMARTVEGELLVAVLVRAGDVPDPSSLLAAVDASAIRPATQDEITEATDFVAALVSPLALPADVLLLADAALGGAEALYAPTGETGVALGISVRDLLVASGARVTALTAGPLAAEELSGWPQAPGLGSADGLVLSLVERRRSASRRTG